MAKRKNGEGTWGIKKIGNHVYKFYRNSDGKYFYGKTEKEINQKIKNSKPNKSQDRDVKKKTFGDYILEWLMNVKRVEIKRHTLDGYEDCIRGQLINYKYNNLSDVQVGAVTTSHFQKYYLSLAAHYTKGTIKKNFAIVSQCIKYGNKKHHFTDPIQLDEIKIPHEDIIEKPTREVQFLSQDDMEKLYIESKRINTPGFNFGGKIGDPTYGNNANIIIFIMFTGLRIGEAIDLKWENIDLDSDVPKVIVKSNAVKIRDRDHVSNNKYIDESSSPKSVSGERKVPLNKQALEIIAKEQKMNPQHKPTDYVFVTKSGGKIKSRQNINRTLQNMITRAGCSVSSCTPHELRHSFGSALLRNGTDIKVVSKLLGHKDVTVTYNVYIHILEEQEVAAVSGLDNIISDNNDGESNGNI